MTRWKTFALLAVSGTVCLIAWGSAKTSVIEGLVDYQKPNSDSAVKGKAANDVSFKPKSALDGLTAERLRFTEEIWESSDGVAIFLRREHCGSPKNAEKILLQDIKDAITIFETKDRLNQKGEKIGKRIVGSFDKDLPQQRIILWTEGEMRYSVESSSFKHALLFEKMFPNL